MFDVTNVVQNNQLNISKSSTPLYYRGYRALNAEINILKNRKSDDPFISGLRDLQEKLVLLTSIKIETEGQHAVTVDQRPPIHQKTASSSTADLLFRLVQLSVCSWESSLCF